MGLQYFFYVNSTRKTVCEKKYQKKAIIAKCLRHIEVCSLLWSIVKALFTQ